MLPEKLSSLLHRWRFAVLGAWLLHAVLIHWFVLGFVSWDGLAYRVPPVVELAQHGRFGMEKYEQWAYAGYLPFVELAHVPFLRVFKLPGLLIGFPLVVFPLCVAAVFVFVRELTGEKRAAVFGAFAYGALPVINQQPFSGYVDFAVCGLLAFFLYSLIRLRTAKRNRWSFLCITLAAALFTMSRAQGVYVIVLLFPIISFAMFCERERFRVRIPKERELGFALAATLLGVIPSIAIQVTKYLRYGTPTYPYQFKFMGTTVGRGVSTGELFTYGGLREETLSEFGRAFVGAWIWPREWPLGGFFDSRDMGGGFVLLVAAALLPTFVRRAGRVEKWLVLGCVLVSLLARDFWLPRYAYTLVIAITVVVARAMCELAVSKRRAGRALFWTSATVLVAHYGRPEWEIAMLGRGGIGPRLNVTGSTAFARSTDDFQPYPDINGRFVIIGQPGRNFALPLYGKGLTNEVVRSLPTATCGVLAEINDLDPTALFIDDYNAASACERQCALSSPAGRCLAYRIGRGEPVALAPGEVLDLGEARSATFLGGGWTQVDAGGRWTSEASARIFFRLAGTVPRRATLRLEVMVLFCGDRHTQDVEVRSGEVSLGSLHFDENQNELSVARALPVSDSDVLRRPEAYLELRPRDLRSPRDLGCNNEGRRLGVFVRRLWIEEGDP